MTLPNDLPIVHLNVLYQYHAAFYIVCFLMAGSYYRHIYPHPGVPHPLFELLIYLACQQMAEERSKEVSSIHMCFWKKFL